ncbi:MAG: type II 3-dehydroquinate dehydratase [Pseudomonadota bacterium]
MTATVLILNGPNLNLLGTREPEIYGAQTLDDVKKLCEDEAARLGVAVDFRQSNIEGELVTWVQEARTTTSGLIINAGGYTHTSVALHDALKAYENQIVEVHISNIYAREEFRHKSYISPLAKGVICGFGASGYVYAMQLLAQSHSV